MYYSPPCGALLLWAPAMSELHPMSFKQGQLPTLLCIISFPSLARLGQAGQGHTPPPPLQACGIPPFPYKNPRASNCHISTSGNNLLHRLWCFHLVPKVNSSTSPWFDNKQGVCFNLKKPTYFWVSTWLQKTHRGGFFFFSSF